MVGFWFDTMCGGVDWVGTVLGSSGVVRWFKVVVWYD